MTSIYRIFEKSTRAITSDKKSYGGQVFDANTTTIHFQILDKGHDWDFVADGYRPFIVFNVYDQYGNPYVYGTDSSPMFSGYEFTIPYEITSQLKSARAEYCLWFVRVEVAEDFNGTNQGLLTTDYLLSAVDGIAFKPSCLRPPKPCGAGMPYAPTTAPSTIGALEFMRENSIILPVDLMGHFENGNPAGLDMIYHTLGGQLQQIHFPVATTDAEGHLPLSYLPVGNGTNKIPILLESIGKGQTIIFDTVNNNGFISSGFRGARLPASLRYVPREGDSENRHLIQLLDADEVVMSTIDLPIENVVESAYYDVEKKDLVIVFGSGEEVNIPVDDLVDIYQPVQGELVISYGTSAEGEKTYHHIGIDPAYTSHFQTSIDKVVSDLSIHEADINNPHQVTKAQVGLGNCDNTSDKDKPVSTAQRNAIDDASSILNTRIDGEMATLNSKVDSVDLRLNNKIDGVDIRLDSKIDSVDARLDSKIDGVNTYLDNKINDSNANIARIDTVIYGDPSAETIEEQRGIIAQHKVDIENLRSTDLSLQSSLAQKADTRYVDSIVDQKQDKLIGGVNIQIDDLNRINYVGPTTYVDNELSSESTNPVQNKVINKALAAKQDALIAGENIAITGNTITATLPKITVDNTISYTSENPVQNKVIARELDRKANIGEGVSVWKGQTSGGQYLYNAGDVVVYEYNLYVSKVDNNDHHPDDESCWNVVRSGALSSVVGLTAATYIGVFGNDAAIDYTIQHNLGSRNLIYSIMTNDSEHEFKQARVSAPTLNTLRVRLTTPPGPNGLVINVMKARTATTVPLTDFPVAVRVSEPSMEWSFANDSGLPLYAKAYDDEGNDITGDIIQNSVMAFSPITVGFADGVHSGTLLLQSTTAENIHEMNGTHLEIPIDSGKRYLVQCYRDGEGQSILDVVQKNGKITVDCSVRWKGTVCLYEASMVKSFTASELTTVSDGESTLYKLHYQHNKGRVVGAQVFGIEGLMMADIHCPTNNTIEVYFNQPVDGELLII